MAAKKNHTLLKLVILLLLVAVIGMGGWLGLSFKRAEGLLSEASASYDQMQLNVEKNDYAQALVDARTAATLTSQAADELDGVQWDLASKLPVLGTDVATMRSISSIAGTLSDDAVIPVLDAWDELSGSGILVDGQLDGAQVQAKAGQVVQLAEEISAASAVVDTCKEQADALPTSHFDQVNGWADELRGKIDSADEVVDALASVANVVLGINSAISTFVGV